MHAIAHLLHSTPSHASYKARRCTLSHALSATRQFIDQSTTWQIHGSSVHAVARHRTPYPRYTTIHRSFAQPHDESTVLLHTPSHTVARRRTPYSRHAVARRCTPSQALFTARRRTPYSRHAVARLVHAVARHRMPSRAFFTARRRTPLHALLTAHHCMPYTRSVVARRCTPYSQRDGSSIDRPCTPSHGLFATRRFIEQSIVHAVARLIRDTSIDRSFTPSHALFLARRRTPSPR